MAQLDTNEYATVLSTLMECARYPTIKAHDTLPGQINNAISVLKQLNSKSKAKQPTGGSIRIVDTSKIKGLFDMFHIDRT